MTLFFTICANNYLARALVLGDSLLKYNSDAEFYIVISDKPSASVDYSKLGQKIIFLEEIEKDVNFLWTRYNTVELATSVKPTSFQFFFAHKNCDRVVYLDPDIEVYGDFNGVYQKLNEFDILLSPHILTPVLMDGKTPSEIPFNQVGIFNLGFLALKKTENVHRFLNWWKERTYHFGYNKVYEGLFTDQLFVNHVPVFFDKVNILKDPGYNIAPWNLHERWLSKTGSGYFVNKQYPLIYYHFSSFDVDQIELPVHKYDRFHIKDRPDLTDLYTQYNEKIKERGELLFSAINPAYEQDRAEHINNLKKSAFKRKGIRKKIFWRMLGWLPVKFKKKVVYFISKDLES